MASVRLTPIVEIEPATPEDLLDGLATLKGRYGSGVLINPPGDGPDRLLNWALKEITSAMHAVSEEEMKHHCVDAVINARRGLACLVDWYLLRDLAVFCKNAPVTPKQQVQFLIARGVIDELTSRVLERAIQRRNEVEHKYKSPPLDVAEDVVELIRRTATAIRLHSAPDHGPWIFGSFPHMVGGGKKGIRAEFHGWYEPLVVFSRFAPRPWVGLVLPENKIKAVIRRALLSETTTEELAKLMSETELKFGSASSIASVRPCELLASEALLQDV